MADTLLPFLWQICYFFYKNIAFGFTLFFFEMFASFSGQAAYNDWFMALYNVFFTSLPAIALGVFDQDVSSKLCLKVGSKPNKNFIAFSLINFISPDRCNTTCNSFISLLQTSQFPLLYQEGIQNVLFSWKRILGWIFNAVLTSAIIFFFCIKAMEYEAFRKGGEVASLDILGATMYTCAVWVINTQMAISISYFTYIQHIFIWGTIVFWYIFLLAYGAINPNFSTTAFMVFIEALAPSPSYWSITLLVLFSCLLPYFAYSSIQIRFFPTYHQMIQWIRNDGQTRDPEFCDMVRQRSIRHTTVGYTARLRASKRVHDNP